MSEAPKRIQRRRVKGWRMPEGAVYVGRGSLWGNPFRGADAAKRFRHCVSVFPVPADRLAAWHDAGGLGVPLISIAARLEGALRLIRGRDLACWCSLDQSCHADVLLKIANGPLRCEAA